MVAEQSEEPIPVGHHLAHLYFKAQKKSHKLMVDYDTLERSRLLVMTNVL